MNEDKKFAVKILEKNEDNLKYFEKELKIAKELDHPNVVKFVEIYVSEKHFYFVMEFCKGENLRNYLKEVNFIKEK